MVAEDSTDVTAVEGADSDPPGSTPGEPPTRDVVAHRSAPTDVLSSEFVGPAFTRGVAAFAVGYIVTLLIVFLGPSQTQGPLGGVLALVGFVFYGAHNVTVAVAQLGSVNVLTYQQNPAMPTIVFWLVPVVVLSAAGLELGGRYLDGETSVVGVGVAVLSTAVGYTVAALAGTYLFRTRSTFGVPAKLDVVAAIEYGFAYAIVFFLLGASLAVLWRRVSSEGLS